MNIEELMNAGAVVSDAPVKRDVTWLRNKRNGGPVSFSVHVKVLAAADVRRILGGSKTSDSTDTDAKLIAECVLLGDDANESFTYEQAVNLRPSLRRVLVRAVIEENEIGDSAPKN